MLTENKKTEEELIPVRMVNEYVYCPRLAYLEWVDSEWAESGDTVEGKHQHRRVDAEQKHNKQGEPEQSEEQPIETRSLLISSERLGITAKLDIVETKGNNATPIDYKHGKRPHIAEGAYQPERVQLCAQGLLLEENGYSCKEGIIYYQASKEKVHIDFDEELRKATNQAISETALLKDREQPPPPLVDSPKCPRCSLVGICLPDELNNTLGVIEKPRPLSVQQEEAFPLHVQSYKAKIKKRGEELEVTVDEDQPKQNIRILDISQLVIMGNAYITTPTLQELMRREIPVSWYSYGGWFFGHTTGTGHKNVMLRISQYRTAENEQKALEISRRFIAAKIENTRTLIRRNWKSETKPTQQLNRLSQLKEKAKTADNNEALLGIEGAAASAYFESFNGLINNHNGDSFFHFEKRNRRPPRDPINAMLSFSYAMLVRDWTVTLSAVGLDPYLGFYHKPRHGRPALSLDMMEQFRPIVADSCVLTAINTGEIHENLFLSHKESTTLTAKGRKSFLSIYERRMSQEITHPIFGYKVSYRRLFEIQARLFGRYLTGEINKVPVFVTR